MASATPDGCAQPANPVSVTMHSALLLSPQGHRKFVTSRQSQARARKGSWNQNPNGPCGPLRTPVTSPSTLLPFALAWGLDVRGWARLQVSPLTMRRPQGHPPRSVQRPKQILAPRQSFPVILENLIHVHHGTANSTLWSSGGSVAVFLAHGGEWEQHSVREPSWARPQAVS